MRSMTNAQPGNIRHYMCLVLTIVIALSSTVAAAEVPTTLTHQGRLTNMQGEPEEGPVDLTFMIYDEVTGGEVVWEQEKTGIALNNGFYTVELGGEDNPLDAEFWRRGPTYITISVDGGAELVPRIPINSVPYASVASHAETASRVEGMEKLRSAMVFDAVASGAGLIGEARSEATAYAGQLHFVGASDEDATGDAPAWLIDSDDGEGYLSMGYALVRTRVRVANNSLGDRLATFACSAQRGGEWQVLDSANLIPGDFEGDGVWRDYHLHCDFLPDDEDQRIGIIDFEPGITDLSIDYVGIEPFPERPFVNSEMIEDDAVGADEIRNATPIYNSPNGCPKSGLTLDSSCTTQACANDGCGILNNQICFYSCNGDCNADMSQSCSADFVGYVVGP